MTLNPSGKTRLIFKMSNQKHKKDLFSFRDQLIFFWIKQTAKIK